MSFASGGLRSTGRKAVSGVRTSHLPTGGTHHGGNGTGSKTMHTSAIPFSTATQSLNSEVVHKLTNALAHIRPRAPTHQLFSTTKSFFTKIFTGLAAPGVRVPTALGQGAGRSLVQSRPISIQSGLSLPVRHTISNTGFKSLGSGTFLPRAPNVPIRGPIASQMGLGTARNFSSGRPIFQNLVDNVPIALRALYEADLDDLGTGRRKQKGLRRMPLQTPKKSAGVKKASMMKPLKQVKVIAAPAPVIEKKEDNATEMDQYFAAPAGPAVTTHLLIPLAPTPTNRVPLSALDEEESARGRFLPLRRIGEVHGAHINHALRVSTLFTRLDQANVWSRGGVVCSAYSGPGATRSNGPKQEADGVCTILKVEFQGWREAEVRGVVGETAKGWCVLEEVWNNDDQVQDGGLLSAAEDDNISALASGVSSPGLSPYATPADTGFDIGIPDMDPADSFILPTLDFSSTFLANAQSERRAFAEAGQLPVDEVGMEYQDPWAGFEDVGSDDGYSSCGSDLLGSISSVSSFEDLGAVGGGTDAAHVEHAWSSAGLSSRIREVVSRSQLAQEGEPLEAMF